MSELPLNDSEKCFYEFYPKCLGMITKCPNLKMCHNIFSKNAIEVLTKPLPSKKALGSFSYVMILIYAIPLIYIILTFMVMSK